MKLWNCELRSQTKTLWARANASSRSSNGFVFQISPLSSARKVGGSANTRSVVVCIDCWLLIVGWWLLVVVVVVATTCDQMIVMIVIIVAIVIIVIVALANKGIIGTVIVRSIFYLTLTVILIMKRCSIWYVWVYFYMHLSWEILFTCRNIKEWHSLTSLGTWKYLQICRRNFLLRICRILGSKLRLEVGMQNRGVGTWPYLFDERDFRLLKWWMSIISEWWICDGYPLDAMRTVFFQKPGSKFHWNLCIIFKHL